MPDSAAASDAELQDHVQRTLEATYDVEKEIGRGGMGVVYRAIDKRLKRPVAIKLLPPELAFRRDVRKRFQREAETAAQLSHPNIVPIYSVDEVGNLVFFVMACVDGDNLATQLQKRGPLPADEIKRYLTEVADALAYAHSRGVIHRDIKPDNILVDALDGRAMVTDFGIARAAEGGEGDDAGRLTATGLAIGTPAYMSPEQASGDRDVDGRSDLYALGVVAYTMLTGEPPFTGNTTPVLLVKHLSETPVPVEQRRPDTPPMLAAMVMRLLEKDPAHRFQSAQEFSEALRSGIVPSVPGGKSSARGNASRGVLPDLKDALPDLPALSGRSTSGGGADHNSGARAQSLAGAGAAGAVAATPSGYHPTAEEAGRWEVPSVRTFRRKVAPYLFVNGALVVFSVFSQSNFLPITAIWTIYLSYQYAKLWSDGYDWRDVLRQPKERMFGDVISDVGDSVHSAFSKKKREELRAEGRTGAGLLKALSPRPPAITYASGNRPADGRSGGGSASGVAKPSGRAGSNGGRSAGRSGGVSARADGAPAPIVAPAMLGDYEKELAAAQHSRAEIARLLATLPEADRANIPDVNQTANSLVLKVEQLCRSLVAVEEGLAAQPLAVVDAEIDELEAQANPLDSGSDRRVRRLATLRRTRRSSVAMEAQRVDVRERLDSCALALENMRLDLVRLRTGGSTVQSVTLIAEEAMALARDVDRAVEAAQEVRDLTSARGVGARS